MPARSGTARRVRCWPSVATGVYCRAAVLEELRITGLGVIEDTTLPLTSGMNVITGETGAGKTMVVTGLGLLFGGRADAGAGAGRSGPRHGRGSAAAAGDRSRERCTNAIADAGAELDDDGTLLLSPHGDRRGPVAGARRRSSRAGRDARRAGRAGAGRARPVRPAAAAAPGRAARLAGPVRRRRAREAAGRSCASGSRAWRAVADDLADRRRNARERNQEADLLRLGLDEITRVDPQPGEDDDAARGGAATRARRGSADRRARPRTSRSAAAPRRARTRRTRCAAARHRAARAGGAGRRRPGARRAGRPGRRGGDPGRRHRRRAGRPTWRVWTPTRTGCRQIYERRAALRALTRKYAEDVDGVIAWADHARDPAGRAGHLRRAARGARPGAGPAGRRGGRAGGRAVRGRGRRRPSASPTR